MYNDRITDKLSLLNASILEAFNSTTEKEIITKYVEAGIKIFGADFGYSFIKSAGEQKFSLLYITPGIDYVPIGKPRKKGIVAKAFQTKQPQLISSVLKTGFIRYDAKSAMESVAVIPITHKNNTYGTLHFAYNTKHEFTEEEKTLYTYLGNSAAQAITIHRLYTDLKDFKYTLDNTLDSIFIFEPEKLKITYANSGAMSLLDKKRSKIMRSTIVELIDGLSLDTLREKINEITENDELTYLVFETWIQHATYGKLPIEVTLEHVCHKGRPERYLAIIRDIRERKQSEDTIRRMAYYDALTGLPNRALLNKYMDEELVRAKEKDGMFALLFLDLDRFKIINDIYGHQIGDQILRHVSQRLIKALPRKAIISRMGGDEFLILIPKIKNAEEVLNFARNIQDKFLEFFQINDQEVYVNCSIGLTIYPQDGPDVRTLLKHIDVALHRSKEQGGNNYQQYNSGLPVFYNIQPVLERQLRQAIKKDELLVHYQPIVSIKTNKIIGCEALIRWNHPEMGLLYPDAFIGHAEESGLIVQVGEWVVNEVCRQIKAWQKNGLQTVPVSINVSPRELLRPTFVDRLETALHSYKIKSDEIKMELTETFLMKNIDLSVGILEQLRLLGVKILIDDFGTGYASLNYLKRLPIDIVKIDRSFIQGSGINVQDAAITSAIIVIAHQLGLEVVAEGVELQQQLDMLKSNNCDSAQGNFFYKPIVGEEFAKLLNKSKK